MTEISARLGLPYLLPSQAQKHVTHNAALHRLDGLVQLVLEATGAETPPADPAEGAIWALGPAPGCRNPGRRAEFEEPDSTSDVHEPA